MARRRVRHDASDRAHEFLEEHPDVVRNLLYGELEAIEYIAEDAARAQQVVNDGIEAITDKRIADEVITAAWPNLQFTVDPIASSLQKSADDAIAAGLLDEVDLSGIYSIDLLNEVLADTGRAGGGSVTLVAEPAAAWSTNGVGGRGHAALRGVRKVFGQGRDAVVALDGIDLDVSPGRVRSASSAPPAAARRRCSTSTLDWTPRLPVRSPSTAGRR